MSSLEHAAPGSTSNTLMFDDAMTKTSDPSQVYVVDSATSSVDSFSLWDNEWGITALRMYYAL
ncbi:hypothetical protein JVU11DRAFT_10673 [Chiua virens]|nr:hypothetical protein JVU11DRAFT_10673 [Chiua virens]